MTMDLWALFALAAATIWGVDIWLAVRRWKLRQIVVARQRTTKCCSDCENLRLECQVIRSDNATLRAKQAELEVICQEWEAQVHKLVAERKRMMLGQAEALEALRQYYEAKKEGNEK